MSFEYSTAEVRKVKRVQFGVLAPDEIKKMSVCEITSPQTFQGGGIPAEVSINLMFCFLRFVFDNVHPDPCTFVLVLLWNNLSKC